MSDTSTNMIHGEPHAEEPAVTWHASPMLSCPPPVEAEKRPCCAHDKPIMCASINKKLQVCNSQIAAQSACSQVVGSCLGSQIFDLAVADNTRIAAGTTPLYLVSRYGGGLPGATQVSPLMACLVGSWSRSVAYRYPSCANRIPSTCCQCAPAPFIADILSHVCHVLVLLCLLLCDCHWTGATFAGPSARRQSFVRELNMKT